MFSKIIITAMLGTGLISASAFTGLTPTKLELAAGPVRIEAGNGKMIGARLDAQSPFTLTIALKNDRHIQIKL